MSYTTESENKREKRNTKICALFIEERDNNPDVSRNRIINAIANKFNMTANGIRNILINNNILSIN